MIQSHQPSIFGNSVIAGVSSAEDGNMKFEWGDAKETVRNTKNFLDTVGINIGKTVNLFIHNNTDWCRIREVGGQNGGEGMINPGDRVSADALITREQSVGLFLPVADCYPVIFFDKAKMRQGKN